MDPFHWLLKFVDHNRGVVITALAIVGALVYSGCATTTVDPVTGRTVDRAQLVLAAEQFQTTYDQSVANMRADYERNLSIAKMSFGDKVHLYELAESDLDAKDLQKEKLLSVITSVSNLNPATAGIMTIAGPLLAGGLGLDNWRKGKRIRKLANGKSEPAPTT